MQDDFISLFAFNRWANAKMLEACNKLTLEQYTIEPVPGWSSIRSTVYHIVIVTDVWLRTLAGDINQQVPNESEVSTVEDAALILDKAYKKFDEMIITFTPDSLNIPKTFKPRSRTFTLPPWAVLRHVVNHTTYHRGQVSSKLKRFGIQQQETDFIVWISDQTP